MKAKKLMKGLMAAVLAITMAVSPVTLIHAQEVTVTSGPSAYTFSEMPVAAFEVTGLNLYARSSDAIVGLVSSANTFILYCMPSEGKKWDMWIRSQSGSSEWVSNLYRNYDLSMDMSYQNNLNGRFKYWKDTGERFQDWRMSFGDWLMGFYGEVFDPSKAQISLAEIYHADAPQTDAIYVIATDGSEDSLAAIPKAFQAAGATIVQIPVADALARDSVTVSQNDAAAEDQAQAAPDTASGYGAVFDSTYYAGHNPDLQVAFGDDSNALLNHFIGYGMAEGLQGNAEFDVWYYKEQYPDLQTAFGEDLTAYYIHYMDCGKAEGRVGSNPLGIGQTAVPEETGYAYEVLELVNQVRAANGSGSLTTTPQLMDTAQLRAEEAATLFSHTRPDGTACWTAFQQNGVTYGNAGENIAAGQRTPQSVMDSWMNSPGHRANILNPDFRHIGIGCYQMDGGYGIYWVQCFTD